MAGGHRTHLHVEVSAESRTGWETFAGDHDLTMASIAEAFGLVLAAGLPDRVENELVRIATQVRDERRSRLP